MIYIYHKNKINIYYFKKTNRRKGIEMCWLAMQKYNTLDFCVRRLVKQRSGGLSE